MKQGLIFEDAIKILEKKAAFANMEQIKIIFDLALEMVTKSYLEGSEEQRDKVVEIYGDMLYKHEPIKTRRVKIDKWF